MEIKHTIYINLEHRLDRKSHVEQQLSSIGIDCPIRFNAVKIKNCRVGCAMSHLKCLKLAKLNNWEHVLIVEDDITFLDPELFVKQLSGFFKDNINYDVLLLGGNVVPPYKHINSNCIQVFTCQTTTGYIVQQHYYDTLIQNIHQGISLLIKDPNNHILYAIDKYWFSLQRCDLWFIIIPLTVIQKENYSDIEERETNYSKLMLDLDKTYLKNVRFIKPL